MPIVTINNKEYDVPEGITIIQACEHANVEIPRFCYHERLEIAGNCRMCLVEVVGGPPKPVASCAMPVTNGMKVFTDSPMVKNAREGVMEFLLANHPLDCPICDQGGECDLQDQAFQYGRGESHYCESKRAVKDKDMGPFIKTTMTRCIHCTRCVRFITDVAGVSELGAVGRGEKMEITPYVEKSLTSELSGNIIDLCPVGALTSKPYAFTSRSWELRKTESIDIMDAVGSNVRIDSRGTEIMRIIPRVNEEINEEWISDKARFCYEGLKNQRLDNVYIRKNKKLEKGNFHDAYEIIASKIANLKGNEISAFSGSLSSCEDIFSMKKFLEKLGSRNFECRLSDEKINHSDRSSYLFNTTISGIDNADACLLIGVNPRKDAPVLNARIRKRSIDKNSSKFNIAAIGCESDLTYNYTKLGNEISVLEKLLNGELEFSKILANSKKPMLIIGSDAIKGDSGIYVCNLAKKIAEKYNMIQESWNGFNFLPKNSGLINGLELGFTYEYGINSLIEKIKNSEIKLTFLLGVDDGINFDDIKNSFIIYIGSHGDKGAEIADIILPGAAYSEKEALYINCEGRPQSSYRAISSPNNSKNDAIIISEIASHCRINIGFGNLNDLRDSIKGFRDFLLDFDKINKANWISVNDLKKFDGHQFEKTNINAADFDFYLTNAISRASRSLVKCSNLNKQL